MTGDWRWHCRWHGQAVVNNACPLCLEEASRPRRRRRRGGGSVPWAVRESGGYVVHADRREGGAVGLYITSPTGDTAFFLIPGPAVAAATNVLREVGGR